MDTQSHTPGPWKHGTPGNGRFCIYSAASHGRGICVMSNTQKISPQELEKYGDHGLNLEALANARLIAAAPELLQALHQVRANFMKPNASLGFPIALVDAAIAKAEGKA